MICSAPTVIASLEDYLCRIPNSLTVNLKVSVRIIQSIFVILMCILTWCDV